MNRRDLLKVGSMIGIGIVLPKLALAQATEATSSGDVVINVTIANNHGHELVLSPKDALEALRATKTTDQVFFDIEGTAGHTHSIGLTHENLLALFVDGSIQSKTSIGAGHNHPFSIRLG